MSLPIISVITAVYNCERFLRDAIESILSQTYQDYEYIIVNDASTDGTADILRDYATNEKIVLLHNDVNRERSYSRNRAISHAKGKFIAIFDADDISNPHRLEKQLNFLLDHPDVDVLGSNVTFIDDNNKELNVSTNQPLTHGRIVWDSLFTTRLAHTSVVMNRSKVLAAGGYNNQMKWVEDTDLWIRMTKQGCRMANLADTLVKYRTSERQVDDAINYHPISTNVRKKFLEELVAQEVTPGDYYKVKKIVENDSRQSFDFESMIKFSHIISSAFQKMIDFGYLSLEDQASLAAEIANHLAFIANRTNGTSKDLILPALKNVSTINWIKYFWQCKKGYLGVKR